jgi:hypothetical protein
MQLLIGGVLLAFMVAVASVITFLLFATHAGH